MLIRYKTGKEILLFCSFIKFYRDYYCALIKQIEPNYESYSCQSKKGRDFCKLSKTKITHSKENINSVEKI